MSSAKALCDFFHEVEQKYALLDWCIEGVYVWPLVRLRVYYDLTQKTGLYQENNLKNKSTFPAVLPMSFFLVNAAIRNPFLWPGAKKYALYVHERKVGGRDIYSDQLMKEMGSNALVLDPALSGRELLPNAKSMGIFMLVSYADRILRRRFCTLDHPINFEKIRTIEAAIKERFGVELRLKNLILERLHKFKFLVPVYKKLLQLKKIEHVYIVNAYSHPFIVAAAQELGLPVTELQHGLITPYHLGYSYPSREKVPYFPDEFLSFGEYWAQSIALPSHTKARVIGAPHIARLLDKKVAKIPNSIFFSSQTVIGREVFNFALNTARLLLHHKITLNLHPQDSPERYREVMAQNLPPNFEMLYCPKGFFDLLAAHEYQAGSFSTTLFEGIVLGNKVILLDLPGAENMNPVLERGDAVFAHTPEELVEKLKEAKPAKNPQIYYAKPVERILP